MVNGNKGARYHIFSNLKNCIQTSSFMMCFHMLFCFVTMSNFSFLYLQTTFFMVLMCSSDFKPKYVWERLWNHFKEQVLDPTRGQAYNSIQNDLVLSTVCSLFMNSGRGLLALEAGPGIPDPWVSGPEYKRSNQCVRQMCAPKCCAEFSVRRILRRILCRILGAPNFAPNFCAEFWARPIFQKSNFTK